MGVASCCANVQKTGGLKDQNERAHRDGSLAVATSSQVKRSAGRIQESYVIGKQIGNGAFGEVRKIKHKQTGVLFCVKIMTKKLMMPK